MSPPNAPGIPGARLPQKSDHGDEGPLQRAARSIRAIEGRLENVEGQLENCATKGDVAELKLLVATFKAVLNGFASKALLLLAGAIGGTYGVTKVTEQSAAPTTTIVQRSGFDRALDACRQLPGGDAQGECIVKVIREQMPTGR